MMKIRIIHQQKEKRMKYVSLVLLCLFLTGCGVFEVNVRLLPGETETARAKRTASAKPVLSPTVSLAETPTPPIVTATALAQPQATPTGLQPGQPLKLLAIQMNDSRQGWAVESSGHIIKTTDGGVSWKNISPFQGAFDTHGLFAFNGETVWVVPSQLDVNNILWSTQDGGETWDASQPLALGEGRYSPLAIQFPNARDGWLLLLARDGAQGNHVLLYKSNDGGQNWELVRSLLENTWQSYLPDTHTSMTFFDGQTGWLGGWWGKDNPNQWVTLKTADGGAHWRTETLALPDAVSTTCNGHPVTEMEPGAMAVDISCTQASDPKFRSHYLHYLSAAGLPAWRWWMVPVEFLGVDFLNASVGWTMVSVGGPLNEIRRTNDGGKTWITINTVAWKNARFNFVNGLAGWAIVSDGSAEALVHTVNGGRSWEEIKPVLANP
jgi:photosystem II stability/assembly factor-like uncharacterized protein